MHSYNARLKVLFYLKIVLKFDHFDVLFTIA